MSHLLILDGCGLWDGSVTEDGLYEGIEYAACRFNLAEDDLDDTLNTAIDALWPPDDRPIGFKAEHFIGEHKITVSIVSEEAW